MLLSQKAVAQRLRTSERSLERMRATGTGPRFVKIGRLVRYTECDLEEWITRRTVNSTSEAEARL